MVLGAACQHVTVGPLKSGVQNTSDIHNVASFYSTPVKQNKWSSHNHEYMLKYKCFATAGLHNMFATCVDNLSWADGARKYSSL